MLCLPASLYLVISMVTIIVLALQNTGSRNVYCVGNYACDVTNVAVIFAMKVVYVLFWTVVLQQLCKSGLGSISWLLVLLPMMFMFLFIAGYMTPTHPTFF
jgi:hypothetical protein